ITHYTYQWIEAGGRNTMCKFLITGLGGEDILLGYPWLHKVNPNMLFAQSNPTLTNPQFAASQLISQSY
ncbi:hypothetical protein SERLA73DRAFT_64372, partial [Serpula lacrymans var. lacrymans S7.3]